MICVGPSIRMIPTMTAARSSVAIALLLIIVLGGCGPVSITYGDRLSQEDLQRFLRKHRPEPSPAAAVMRALGSTESYLATVHGYPNNLAVCEELIEPYNLDPTLSVLQGGHYYCIELR